MKYCYYGLVRRYVCRAPQGARGLKYFLWESGSPLSHGRAPQGARGLKSQSRKKLVIELGRAPQGARGLKLSCRTR